MKTTKTVMRHIASAVGAMTDDEIGVRTTSDRIAFGAFILDALRAMDSGIEDVEVPVWAVYPLYRVASIELRERLGRYADMNDDERMITMQLFYLQRDLRRQMLMED